MELRIVTRHRAASFSLRASLCHSMSVRLRGERSRRHNNSSRQQQSQINVFAVTVIVVALGRSMHFISFPAASLLNLTQAWKILRAPLGSTVAFTASICLHPRPLRECAEPQGGNSLPRRSPLIHYKQVAVKGHRNHYALFSSLDLQLATPTVDRLYTAGVLQQQYSYTVVVL